MSGSEGDLNMETGKTINVETHEVTDSNAAPAANTPIEHAGKQSDPSDEIETDERSPDLRRSERNLNKGKLSVFNTRLETQSEYHSAFRQEILDSSIQVNHDRLDRIAKELEDSITEIHTTFEQLKHELGAVPKEAAVDVDRLTRDSDQLQDKVKELIHQLVAKESSSSAARVNPTNTRPPSIASSTRTHTSTARSSRSSSSSALRRQAYEAKAEEEAIKARLEILQEQEDHEAQLTTMKIQQEYEIAKKKREIERTILQAEMAAEKRRKEVFEQAAAEEEEGPQLTLFRPPKPISVEQESINPIRNRSLETKVRRAPDSTKSPESKSDQQLLAEAILGAIDHSIENPKLENPKPHIFSGQLTDYPDWRAAVNRFIRDRRGPPEDKLALLRSYLSTDHHRLINAYCTMGTESALAKALESLDEEFGNAFQIGKAYKRELQTGHV